MTNFVAKSPKELQRTESLLNKDIPSYRQAYSDRTAWLMACLSELAYIKFNPFFSTEKKKKHFLGSIEKLVDADKKSSLIKLIDLVGYDHNEEKKELGRELRILYLSLVETFDKDGTQAILVKSDKFIVLAFRGIENMNIRDIKLDVKATTTQCETGGKVHTGFNDGYEAVAITVQNKINESEFQKTPLFITGHGWGGSLATIAAKKLSHKGGIAACYTFGAPRVGDGEWVVGIKTPIYRVVNATDCVTMLPSGDETVTVIAWTFRCIESLGVPFISQMSKSFAQWLLSNLGGYIHGGDVHYMTNCKKGQYDNVKLLYSASLFRGMRGWLYIKKNSRKKFLADHSIGIYRKKLMIIAERRNKNTPARNSEPTSKPPQNGSAAGPTRPKKSD